MKFKVNFIPLSFINSEVEILNLIRNTFVFSSLFNRCEEVTLNHYLESTQYGFTASASDFGTHKLVRITDIKDGGVEWSNVPFCNCENDIKYLLHDNDILIARTGGTTGKSFMVKDAPKNAVYASYLIRLRIKKDVDINFITAYLNSYVFWSQIVELKAGSAMPNVNAEKLKTLRIPKCDLVTQKHMFQRNDSIPEVHLKIQSIESIFRENKLLLAELSLQLTLVKQLRQSFLREAMQGKLTADFRTAHPELIEGENSAQALLEKIKAEKKQLIKDGKLKKEKELAPIGEDEIPFEIPEGWAWCRLNDIITILGDGIHGTPNYDSQGDYYFINGNNLINGKIEIKENTKKVSEQEYEKHKKHLTNNTIFISINGTLGNIAYYNEEKIILGKSACYFNLMSEIKKYYIGYYIKSSYFFKYAVDAASETTIKNVSLKSMRLLPLPFPPLSEQQAIVSKLDELMRTCDELEASIRRSQQQNEMLLQQVLREALEEKKEEPVLQMVSATRKSNISERTILAAYLIRRFNSAGFGRVMLMKLLFLVEYICQIDFESKYIVNVAGPYDDLILEIESKLRRYGIYDARKNKIDNHVHYLEMSGVATVDELFEEKFSGEREQIESIIRTFKKAKWEQCEIVATLYAVWNNRIIKGQLINDLALKQDFLNWDPHKKRYADRLDSALDWMRGNNIIPAGWGSVIEK